MTDSPVWKETFVNWPAELPRRGILVGHFDEQIPFSGFMTNETMLMVERRNPDSLGARYALIPYSQITAVKFVDVLPAKSLAAAGFKGDLQKR